MASLFHKTFSFEVLTPAGRLCRLDVTGVVFPASDGDVGVLAGRAPMVAVVGTGRMTAETDKEGAQELYVSGGFACVRESDMTVLAEECIPMAEVDAEEAWDELEQAKRLPVETDQQLAARDEAVHTARTKFRWAPERRRRAMQD